jgi:hypothetical protein
MAFDDGTNGSKASVMTYSGSSWVTLGAADFSAGLVNYPSLAVLNNVPYVAYVDNANSNKATVMRYQ